MSSLQGYATQLNPTTQVVCAYAAAKTSMRAIATSEDNEYYAGTAIGSFTVPETVLCRLRVLGSRSSSDVTLTVALYSPDSVVGSTTQVTATEEESVSLSTTSITLVPNKVYQIVAKAVSPTGAGADIGTISLVHLVDP